MKNEKWIEDVFDSIKGSHRAQPSEELFAKIESQIEGEATKIIPMNQWRMAIAAAVIILMVNVFAMKQYSNSKDFNNNELVTTTDGSRVLISNYKIYE